MFNFSRHNIGRVDEENPYWISFSDIMAGLLVIFILASLQLILQLTEQKEDVDEKIEAIERAHKVRSELLKGVKESLEKQGITVEISANESVLRIPSWTLSFASDSAEIPLEQQNVVKAIGGQLSRHLTDDRRRHINTIFVEGHTDSQPSSYKGVGNWLLSTDRAVSVWRYWGGLETSKGLWLFRNERGERMFSVSGYGESRRVVEDDSTPDLRERNRRIDLRFTIREPKACEYEGIIKGLLSPC